MSSNQSATSRFQYYANADASFNVERNTRISRVKRTLQIIEVNLLRLTRKMFEALSPLNLIQSILIRTSYPELTMLYWLISLRCSQITETWLNSSVTNQANEVIPSRYQIIRRDRQSGRCGLGELFKVEETIALSLSRLTAIPWNYHTL